MDNTEPGPKSRGRQLRWFLLAFVMVVGLAVTFLFAQVGFRLQDDISSGRPQEGKAVPEEPILQKGA
jgi:hypothetical protein